MGIRYKKTNFKAGGLRRVISKDHKEFLRLETDGRFMAPPYIDSRPYCLTASNQGDFPACAGFAVAGYLEVHNWIRTGYPEQVNGLRIYEKAKELDGQPDVRGTTLDMAFMAALELGLVGSEGERWDLRFITTRTEVMQSLHEQTVLMAGFLVNEAWNSVNRRTGYIYNGSNQGSTLGGHAVLVCWYDEREGVGFQNSWDSVWGWNGFGRMTWEQFDAQFMGGLVATIH